MFSQASVCSQECVCITACGIGGVVWKRYGLEGVTQRGRGIEARGIEVVWYRGVSAWGVWGA